jgi:hypothetical protein
MPWSVPGGLRRIEVLWVFEYFERKNENKREECIPWLLCNSYPTPLISSLEVYYSTGWNPPKYKFIVEVSGADAEW